MKNILIILILLLSAGINAQEFEAVEDDVEIMEEFVIEDAYESKTTHPKLKTEKINDTYSFYFDENQSSYRRKYGLLKNGKMLLPQLFKRVQYTDSTHHGKLLLNLNGQYGLFSLTYGNWVINPVYKELNRLNDGLYLAKNNENLFGLIDSAQNQVTEFKWGLFKAIENDKYFLVKEIDNENKYGVYDVEKKVLIVPCIYEYIGNGDKHGLFLVRKNNKYNLVDTLHNEQFVQWYDLIRPLKGFDVYIVKSGEKHGLIDLQGKLIIPLEYDEIDKKAYPDGSVWASNEKGLYGCINVSGKVSLPFEYVDVQENNGFLIVEKANKLKGVITFNESSPIELVPVIYEDIQLKKNAFLVKRKGKYGMIDINGGPITPIEFDEINQTGSRRNKKGLHVASVKGKYFFIDNAGQKADKKAYKEIIPFVSYRIGSYYIGSSVYYVVKNKKDKAGLADIYGKLVVPVVFDDIIEGWDNFIVVQKEGKVGLYHILKKKVIIDARYDKIILTSEGFFAIEGNTFYKIAYDGIATAVKM